MNKQRKVLITITYNELGIITDTKAEEVTRTNLQPTCNQLATDICVGDTISRRAALDAIVQCTNCGDEDTLREYVLKHSLDNGWTGGILEALDAVKDLPPAQPEPKEGHWIDKGWNGDWAWQIDGRGNCWRVIECSECGKRVLVESNYCPKCGAKMKGEQHETD